MADSKNGGTIEGKVIDFAPAKARGDKGFRIGQLVVETGGQYPQQVPVEFAGKHADLHGVCTIGDDVRVYFDVRGREWKGRWYASLSGWKVEKIGDGAQPQAESPAAGGAAHGSDALVDADDSALPF
jgi:single-strand DNA-binding protein